MNMKTLHFAPLAASFIVLSMVSNAHAVEPPAPAFSYYIEQFQIDKKINVSGTPTMTTIFLDPFDSATNTLAPDLYAPAFLAGGSAGLPANYGVFGTFAADALDGSGKLRLDNTGTALSSDPFGNPVYVQHARLQTSTTDGNTEGLKLNTSFAVTAIFDLTAPVAGSSYGIRLTDKTTLDPLGNDSLSLLVRNSANGINIDFRKSDFLMPSNATVDSAAASFASPFIALRLSHDNSTPNQLVTASFAYLSSVSLASASWTTFGTTSTVFNGENFTRAEFRANTAPVPEADTWAMMAVGVGLIGLQLRRRSPKLLT
jgi:hypothetical protein